MVNSKKSWDGKDGDTKMYPKKTKIPFPSLLLVSSVSLYHCS